MAQLLCQKALRFLGWCGSNSSARINHILPNQTNSCHDLSAGVGPLPQLRQHICPLVLQTDHA